MPSIAQYFAPDRILRPSESGFAAAETAGRRLGGLYNQAGQDERRIGQLQDEAIRARGWPWNVYALEARARAGGGVRVNLGRSSDAFPGDGHSMAAHHASLAGGVAMANWFANAVAHNPNGGELIDVTGGTTSLGRQTVLGTAFPASKGGLLDFGGQLTPEQMTPANPVGDVGEGLQPSDARMQGGAGYSGGPNGNVPFANSPAYTSSPDYGYLTGGSGPGQIGSSTTTPQSNSGFTPDPSGGGWFSGLRDFLHQLNGTAEDAGADLGAGPMTGF